MLAHTRNFLKEAQKISWDIYATIVVVSKLME
jgi:hypothetical protein